MIIEKVVQGGQKKTANAITFTGSIFRLWCNEKKWFSGQNWAIYVVFKNVKKNKNLSVGSPHFWKFKLYPYINFLKILANMRISKNLYKG